MQYTYLNKKHFIARRLLFVGLLFLVLFQIPNSIFHIPVVSAQGPENPVSKLFESRYAPPITRLGEVASYGGGGGLLVRLVNWFIAIFWIVAVGFVIWAAFLFLTANGEEDKITLARKRVQYALIAAVVALLATGIKPITFSLLRGGGSGESGGGGVSGIVDETKLSLNGKDCLDPFKSSDIEINDNIVNLALYDSVAERQRQQAPQEPVDVKISSTASGARSKTYSYDNAKNVSVNICNPADASAQCGAGSYTVSVKIDYTIGGSGSLDCRVRYNP